MDRRSVPPHLVGAALLACALPTLIAYNLPPSPTFFNQAAALAGWGVFVACNGAIAMRRPAHRAAWLLAALAAMGAAVGVSMVAFGLPSTLGLSAIGLLAAAALAALAGAAGRPDARSAMATAFFAGWLVTGLLGTALALVQVFQPAWADGGWIARSGFPGRAVGNLRQPNHLSTLLLWSAIAVIPLTESRWLPRVAAVAAFAAVVVGVQLTGSRTGTVGIVVLAAWGLLDRRLSVPARALLLAAPVLYGLAWAGLSMVAADGQGVGAATRVGEGDLSASRFGIWSNTWALILAHPWAGVGFGGFNFAWTLTPFPGRPVAFFDHTHNLPLQLWVELGVPAGTAVLAMLSGALWQAARLAWATACDDATAPARRAGVVMLLLIGLHSLLEYPLWYAYFLLPAAWVWGLCLGADRHSPHEPPRAPGRSRPLLIAGMGLVIAACLAFADYLRVVRIFAPGERVVPLSQRIADGRRSVLFGHHGDYALATTSEPPETALEAFERASHYLLDARLMRAWARALEGAGQSDRARHLARRLAEFRNPQTVDWFAPCSAASMGPSPAADGVSGPVAGGGGSGAGDAAPPDFPCREPASAPGWSDYLGP